MSDEIGLRGGARNIRDSLSVASEAANRDTPQIYEFGPFRLEPSERKLLRGNEIVALTPKAFDTLVFLVRNSGHLIEKDELLRRLWPDSFVEEGSLSNNIFMLRKALGEDPPFIETVPRRGYRFVGAVRQLPDAAPTRLEKPLVEGHREVANEVSMDLRPSSAVVAAIPKTAAVEAGRPDANTNFRWIGVLAAVIVISAIAATFVWLRLPQTPPRVLATTKLTKDDVPKNRLLTDGARLYIEEDQGTRAFVVQAALTGGETSLISTPFGSPVLMDISPDHSQLLVGNGFGNEPTEFWALPLPSGPPHRIADVTGSYGKWSPDGRQLVFAKGGNVLYLAKADGTDARMLCTVANGVVWQTQFSPDSTRIRFGVWNDKERSSSIWEIRTDGTDLHPLLPGWRNPPAECCGVWSPNVRYFLFLVRSSPVLAGGNIWALQESNSAFRKYPSRLFQLTAGPMLFGAMTWSPDGKKLFARGFQNRGELIRYDAQRREFVSFLSGIWATDVHFSRDGEWIAYVSYPEGALWRSRVDGSDRLQLTNPPVFAAHPRWSPDGKQIAFMDMQAGRPWKILLISAEGGAAKEMLAENLLQSDPGWSPDGKQMVFGRYLRQPASLQLLDLNSKQVSIIPGSQGLYSPRWSPDGRYLAALTTAQTKIVVFDFNRKIWSDWVSGHRFAYPTWSRDGKYLYFETWMTDTPGYYRVQLGQTGAELVVDLKDLHQFSTASSGVWSAITPDGSPLFVRDVSTDEIYALDLELP